MALFYGDVRKMAASVVVGSEKLQGERERNIKCRRAKCADSVYQGRKRI